MIRVLSYVLMPLLLCSCSGVTSTGASEGTTASTPAVERTFDGDSALAMAAAQTAFGPRVPGTPAHDRCGAFLVERLQALGADTVIQQRTTVRAYNGTSLPINNIMARFNPDAPRRVLLLAHWDSRPWADAANDPALRRTPIDGANDGASGVAVLLEVARQIALGNIDTTQQGIDILMVDAEDYGRHADEPADTPSEHDDSWALGTQYWVQHMPYANTSQRPQYAILLDMVGGRDAVFTREYFSEQHAPAVNNSIWAAAARLGLQKRFPNRMYGAVTDDHIWLNRAGIPTADIIECANPQTGSFNPTWHTPDDNIQNLSAATLSDVGAVVVETLKYTSNQ